MGAGHNHGHNHAHVHGEEGGPQDNRARLWLAFGITFIIVVAQLVGALITGSLALLTDTAHAVTDASGLLVALMAANPTLRPATSKRTWGFRRVEVIAALAAVGPCSLVVGTYAAIEGIRRLFEPPEVPAMELLVFGVIGLMANVTALKAGSLPVGVPTSTCCAGTRGAQRCPGIAGSDRGAPSASPPPGSNVQIPSRGSSSRR